MKIHYLLQLIIMVFLVMFISEYGDAQNFSSNLISELGQKIIEYSIFNQKEIKLYTQAREPLSVSEKNEYQNIHLLGFFDLNDYWWKHQRDMMKIQDLRLRQQQELFRIGDLRWKQQSNSMNIQDTRWKQSQIITDYRMKMDDLIWEAHQTQQENMFKYYGHEKNIIEMERMITNIRANQMTDYLSGNKSFNKSNILLSQFLSQYGISQTVVSTGILAMKIGNTIEVADKYLKILTTSMKTPSYSCSYKIDYNVPRGY